MDLARSVYKKTESFPSDEKFGLISQLRRAAVSVPSNIAEGSQRTTKKDFAHFLLLAKGSLAELETQLRLSADFTYLTSEDLNQCLVIIDELNRMIYSFHSKLVSHNS